MMGEFSVASPVCQVRMWWGLLGGVAPISLDGVELLWL